MVKRKKEKTRSKSKRKPKSKPKVPKDNSKEEKKAPKPVIIFESETWNDKPINQPDFFAADFKQWYKAKKFEIEFNAAGNRQKAIYDSYLRKDLIPVYIGKSSELIPIQMFSDLPKTEWVAESSQKMEGRLTKSDLKDEEKFRTLRGNQIQTQISKKTGKFVGFYYQNKKKENFMPTLFNAEKIRVDPDAIGHFQAWFIQEYANPDLKFYNENFKEYSLNFDLAMRGMSSSILDSKAFFRNRIVKKVIKDAFGSSALAWLPKGGKPRDLSVSDQMVRACGLIVQDSVDIEVSSPDFVATFPWKKIHEFKEQKPKLVFKVKGKPKIEPLDSDTLLRIGMRKMKMESTAVQNLLEALYQQRWISYPRANITKAEAEPIRIRNPKTGKVIEDGHKAQALVKKEFKGTLHEKQLIDLIVKSQIALKQKKPFLQEGHWELVSGDLSLDSKRKDYLLIVGEPTVYVSNQIDIDVGERGVREEDLVADLIYENVATPSTRTAMLEELKNAGVLSRRANKLILDRRGYYLAALDKFYTENEIERSYQLKNILPNLNVKQMKTVVSSFDWIPDESARKAEMNKYLKKEANALLKAEEDLAYLDREGERIG